MHAQEMENRLARQRIHYQELKDQQLINKRQEGTMGIMLEDARRKLKQARTKLDQVTQERQQWEVSIPPKQGCETTDDFFRIR